MSSDAGREDIAVIGMAGRFPSASSIDELWSLLVSGKEGIVTLADQNPPPGGTARAAGRYVPRRGIVADIDQFDAEFFRMSGAEADLLDPQHRLLLEVAWEALEDSLIGDCEGQALGVFVSTGISQYLLQNLLPTPGILEQHGPLQLLLLNDKDTIATRISYFLNARGPSLAVQTGCSSSLVALHIACRSLLEDECTAALVGGVSLALPQDVGYFYSEQMIHSHDGRCRAFDDEASGTVRGNGACAVVIKRLSAALEAGDPIWAVVKGSAVNNDGRDKVGFTAPSSKGQAAVIAAALKRSGVPAEDIELIEAHGTGTPLGDPVEAQALKAAFGDVAFPAEKKCAIGAVKANLGHLDSAAGLTGLIKVCLSLAHEEIPPVVHFRRLNSRINFEGTPFFINAERIKWPRREKPRRAGVSAFGIGGTNVHVVLEEGPAPMPTEAETGPFLFVVSAATATAFTALCERYRAYLVTLAPERLASFGRSTLTGRKAFPYRAAFVVNTLDQAIEALRSARPTVAKRRVRKLSIEAAGGALASAAFAERLAALGIDGVIADRSDLHIKLAAGTVEIFASGGTLSLPEAGPSRGFDLALLAALWERGVHVDWTQLFGRTHRLRIPTYPFARERHWIDTPASGLVGDREPLRGPMPVGYEAFKEAIVSEWRALTGKRYLRAEDNFFDAGATSLMVGQFIANCCSNHGLAISAVDCYRDPTSSALALALVSRRAATSQVAINGKTRADPTEDAETFTEL
jgi:acyl transferase domain-containing protein